MKKFKINLFIMNNKKDKKISPYLLHELITEIQYNVDMKLIELVKYASKVSKYYLRKKLPENDIVKYKKILKNERFLSDLVMYALKNKIETEKELQNLKFKVIENLNEIEQLYKEIYFNLKK